MFWSYFLMSFPMLLLLVAHLELFRVVAGQFCQQGVFKPNKEPKPLGMENFDIANSQITASTTHSSYNSAYNGRLNSYRISGFRSSVWASAVLDTNQWLQVNFLQTATVVKISTQGRAEYDQRVTIYTVSYSNDGVNFQSYQENGQTKVFSGNSDRNSIVAHTLSVNIVAQFIRIHPQTWNNHIAMRAEFYGSYPGPTPLGMENNQILNSQITASSMWDSRYAAHAGRLNFKTVSGGIVGPWVAGINDANQWLQVDFLRNTTVVQISTQGRNTYPQWITSYKISSSNDGTNFQFYQKTIGETMVFSGNSDKNTVVSNSLSPVIAARFVRVHPQTWVKYVSMRVEFYSWSKALKPLGMENYQILDSQLDASSAYNMWEGGHVGRLNLQPVAGVRGDAWVAKHIDQNQWLQVDFLLKMTVAAIGTQGRTNLVHWSTSYKVSSGNNGVDFQFYKQNGQTTEFTGNTDRSTVVLNALVPVVTARFLRIHVTGWQDWIVLRAEFYGWHEANFASFHASSSFDCSQRCTGATSCASFDFRRVSNQNEINCKLNDVKEDLKTDAESAGWGHYELQDFSKMPCPSNHLCRFGKCVVDSCDPKGYRCECNESYQGELCDVAI